MRFHSMKMALAGTATALVLSLVITSAEARPYQYASPAAYAPPAAQPSYRAQTQTQNGVRLNIPWQQWSNDVEPQQAYAQQSAPRYNARQYASYANSGANYYYPPETYNAYRPGPQPMTQAAPSAWQPPEPYGMPQARGGMDPRFMKQVVDYQGRERPGTLVIDTNQKFLFLVQAGGQAIRYGIGVGKPGFEWSGIKQITRKAEWPDWTPPDEMIKRRPDLPRFMPGGPGNPLGARAMYLGSSLYRIHGTNEPQTIGKAVSSGCIRMVNDDVMDLYSRVRVGAKVIVI